MNIKSLISNTLRRLHLISTAERIRFFIVKTANAKKNSLFKATYPDIKIPPDYFLYETYALDYSQYYFDGLNTAQKMIRLVSAERQIDKPGLRWLDWGCGPGRLVRHLPNLLPSSNIYGIDYNKEYIAWCKSNIHGVTFSLNDITPPTDYSSDFFDVIIGISIFTHLSEDYHIKWVEELGRLLKPDGVALVTTQGNSYRFKLSNMEKQRFDSGRLVIRGNVVNGNRLFSAFHPASFIRAVFQEKFDVLTHYPGSANLGKEEQDIWLIRKK